MLAGEKKARSWDRWVTGMIIVLLLIPLPFARFESWPTQGVLLERLILPWSHFRFCYVRHPDGETVEERYRFDWKGTVIPRQSEPTAPFLLNSQWPPLLKWQNAPEIRLEEVHRQGGWVRVRTVWQPIVVWPLRSLLRVGRAMP
jgi:hypothetical protein